MKTCNVCGKKFEENELELTKSDDGTEYYICTNCKEDGVKLTQTTEYYICRRCGYPHTKKEFKGTCKFCEQKKGFEKVELTQPEEELLDTDPQKLYKEKLGKDAAQKIHEWIESPERKEVGIRHKRDRIIDTSALLGIIASYVMLEITMNKYDGNKINFVLLMIPTVLTIISSPIYKKIDRMPRNKPLPLWLIYVINFLIVMVYAIISLFI